MEATKIDVRNLGDTVVISVDGSLAQGQTFQLSGDTLSGDTGDAIGAIRELIAQQLSKDAKNVVLDLTHCNGLDSAAIGYLVISSSKLAKEGVKFALVVSPDSRPLVLLKMTNTIKILPAYESVESAAQALGGAKTM